MHFFSAIANRFFAKRKRPKSASMKWVRLVAGFLLVLIGAPLLAASNADLAMIQTSIRDSGHHTMGIVGSVSIAGGMVFFISSVFSLYRWKQNPQQISVGQGISLMFIGVAMVSLPFTISSARRAVMGTSQPTNHLGDNRLANIVAPPSLDDGGSI